jgi:hypothetical protein
MQALRGPARCRQTRAATVTSALIQATGFMVLCVDWKVRYIIVVVNIGRSRKAASRAEQ